jgi:hypothetical protein
MRGGGLTRRYTQGPMGATGSWRSACGSGTNSAASGEAQSLFQMATNNEPRTVLDRRSRTTSASPSARGDTGTRTRGA